MKTTKSKQDQTRRLVVRTAVDLITEHGYDATTMKQIARAAGIGDATIYKYFPTKEKLLIAYFELIITDVLADTAAMPELDQYTLHERLQLLVDGVLEAMLGDREFVEITRTMVGRSPLLMMRDGLPCQQVLKQQVAALLAEAEEKGEIAECDLKEMIAGFFADYLFSVIVYWLKDDSDEFSNTTQLVELTLAVLVLTLKSGLMNKLSELGGFLVRSQMTRLMQN
ncbi:MAG: TetR/AcrR family transcriptional regulator, partial [Sideroxyarcus sp.]|nr:TetR/AcrR family transcriptional regulator [Sideroxyarcus sp.]